MTTDDAPADAPTFDMGAWLVERRGLMDRTESAWLEVLADYDDAEGWAADGQLSCADWLSWRLGMGRSTAFEKLRIAHELRRRPQVAAAFAAGEISYSAVRALTRIDRPDPEVDEALLELAKHHPVIDLERAVRCYQLYESQDGDDDSFLRDYERRGIHIRPAFQRMGAAQLNLTAIELAEFAAGLQMFIDRGAVDAVDHSSRGDSSTGEGDAGDESSGGDTSTGSADNQVFNPWWQRRADAFMDMVRTATAHAQDGHAVGADRYMVHAVADIDTLRSAAYQRSELLGGRLLDERTLSQLACDASIVTHLVDGDEPLQLGRKTRVWNTAQRRAIAVRDGGRCRYPGCQRTICDIHHVCWWSEGG